MTTESEREPRPVRVAWQPLQALMRSLAVGWVAGFAAGLVALGFGSRIAMRIVAITAGDADQGAITDAEATVGEITAGGTIFLAIFGAFIGTLGGYAYLALRRWLADAGRWRGLLLGMVLLAMFGWGTIEGDNPDFDRFGSPGLNIAMFASLFLLFGLLLVPLFDRLDRRLAPLSLRHPTPGSLAAHGAVLLFALPMAGAIGSGFGEEGDAFKRLFSTLLPLYVLLGLPIGALLLSRRNGGF